MIQENYVITADTKCVGCLACYAACKHNAIKVKSLDGFLYPEVDIDNCVGCGECKRACSNNHNNISLQEVSDEIYACQLINCDVLCQSTSGGFFYGLSSEIINRGGAWQVPVMTAT